MITPNISGKYDITGTNEGVLFGLSTDTKPTGGGIGNGYMFVEMDTSKLYFYDAEGKRWLAWG